MDLLLMALLLAFFGLSGGMVALFSALMGDRR